MKLMQHMHKVQKIKLIQKARHTKEQHDKNLLIRRAAATHLGDVNASEKKTYSYETTCNKS